MGDEDIEEIEPFKTEKPLMTGSHKQNQTTK